MRAENAKRADPVNRSVNNIRLTLDNYERSDNGVQSTTAEATISIDYIRQNFCSTRQTVRLRRPQTQT